MKQKKKILVAIGTRPEAIKLAPVVLALGRCDWAEVRVLATAQHREMLDQVMTTFGIQPDIDLNLMRPNQSLPELTARILTRVDEVLSEERPDVVLVQGDTTTVLAVALASFYRGVDIGHVEAGLRTGDMRNPFPEEMNRVLTSRLARWHFAPTRQARMHLEAEGISPGSIHVTGNTVIDALLDVSARDVELPFVIDPDARLILVTAHRRENFGDPVANIIRAVKILADRYPDVQIVFPVHPNPNIAGPVTSELKDYPRVTLCPPQDYVPFVALMKRATLILTDSGGVQEEAPALGKPVLVLRAETERPEAVEEGVVKLVGSNTSDIVDAASRLLDDATAYQSMAKGVSPYGDGRAAGRVAQILEGN